MNLDKLYTVDDVAKFTNLTSRTIRTYLKEGILKGKKIGGQWRFTMDDISKLLNNNSAVTDMINANDQNLIDFINGTNTDIPGELQICTVADYYCESIEYASLLSRNFSEYLAEYTDNEYFVKYNYHYNTTEQKARYIFYGTPAFIIKNMEILNDVWNHIHLHKGSFSGKAKNYLKGRPKYPAAFFNYLYSEFGINKNDVIADIGSGVGKMSKHFLERGNKVFCVEPNKDMRIEADELLSHYKHYNSIAKSAEDTGIITNSVDYIVCGNSYDYFDRNLSVPEFKRILKNNGKVIITYYGPHNELYYNEINELNSKYAVKDMNPLQQKKHNFKGVFQDNKFIEGIFDYTFNESYDDFIEGCLSYSRAPKPEDEYYELYCNGLNDIFDKYNKDGKLENTFRLKYYIGNVDDLY